MKVKELIRIANTRPCPECTHSDVLYDGLCAAPVPLIDKEPHGSKRCNCPCVDFVIESTKDPSLEAAPALFPKPSRQTRGLMNSYACGCQVRRDASGGYFIHACDRHNAAPAIYEALVKARDTFADLEKFLRFVGRVPSADACQIAGESLTDVLSLADGQQQRGRA